MKKNHTVTRLDKVRIKKIIEKSRQSYSELIDLIDNAHIIEAIDVPKDLVTMNCRVRCQKSITKEIIEMTLVYPRYAKEDIGNISILSNVGTALFSKRVGDVICYQSNEETKTSLTILEILYQPEDAGHYLI